MHSDMRSDNSSLDATAMVDCIMLSPGTGSCSSSAPESDRSHPGDQSQVSILTGKRVGKESAVGIDDDDLQGLSDDDRRRRLLELHQQRESTFERERLQRQRLVEQVNRARNVRIQVCLLYTIFFLCVRNIYVSR